MIMLPKTQHPSPVSIVACALIVSAFANAQSLVPQARFSTHDWTAPNAELDFRDGFADVKTPGDGQNYAVGTTEFHSVTSSSTFSGAPVSPPPGTPFFTLPGPSDKKQVAILQITNAAQGIVQQRYFYGLSGPASPPSPLNLRATTARGISVWPAASLTDTRVVICGETFDDEIPLSQVPPGSRSVSGLHASGFIAVYDGNATLLWTHH